MNAFALVVTLGAALCIAVSTSLEHRGASDAPPSIHGSLRLLTHLVRRPIWLLGLLFGLGGTALHALAIGSGALTFVSPLMVSVLVFALPVRAALDRRPPSAHSVLWAALTAVGLAVFVVASHPTAGAGRPEQLDAGLLIVSGSALALFGSWAAARAAHAGRQHWAGLVLGAAGGVLFGLIAGLLKLALIAFAGGWTSLLTSWEAWALVPLGLWAYALNQRAYHSAPLSISMPILTVLEPLVAAAFGYFVLAERPADQPVAVALEAAGVLAMVLGVIQLWRDVAPAPADGPAGAPTGGLVTRVEGRRAALPPGPPRVAIVSGSVGAGHDGVARELARRLRRDGIEVSVLDHLDLLPFPLRRALTDGYAVGVGRVPAAFEWLFQRLEDSRPVLAAADLLCRLAGRRLATAVADADVVVSTYPLASRSLGQLVRCGRVRAASVTYLTDPAPHRTWVHPDIGLHLTVTEPTALAGQRRYGVPMRPSGPLVPPAFAQTSRDGRHLLRRDLGLGPADVAVLLTTGSIGLGDVEPTAAAVRSAGAVPIVLCGRSTRLRRTLEAAGYLALGWRDDVPALMAACDVLVHNAGGLSLTEALVVGLPCVTFAPIAGHGRANAALLEECGLVPWARTPEQLAVCLRRVLTQTRQPLPDAQQPAAAVIAELARDAAAGRGLDTESMEPAAVGA